MYEALTAANTRRWNEMTITPSRKPSLTAEAGRVHLHKDAYVAVETRLRSLGLYVPWWAIGVIHLREADLNFNAQLAQGDPLGAVSRHVPAGRGPFYGADAFLRGCLDALIDCAPHAAHWTDWSPGGTATIFELYNGLGYANKGLSSPYNWSGTDQYVRGKYVSDGVFSATEVDVQPGCMPVVKCMIALDPSIAFGPPKGPVTIAPAKPAPSPPVAPTVAKAPEAPGLWTRLEKAVDALKGQV
jgi:lysozyme family protein